MKYIIDQLHLRLHYIFLRAGTAAWEQNGSLLGIGSGSITVTPIKLETGLRPNSAGIPYTLLLRTEAMGFPTFGLLLYKEPKTTKKNTHTRHTSKRRHLGHPAS